MGKAEQLEVKIGMFTLALLHMIRARIGGEGGGGGF